VSPGGNRLCRAIIAVAVIGQVEVAAQDRINDVTCDDDANADTDDRQPSLPDQFPAGCLPDAERLAKLWEV